jgi:hypothetical protein
VSLDVPYPQLSSSYVKNISSAQTILSTIHHSVLAGKTNVHITINNKIIMNNTSNIDHNTVDTNQLIFIITATMEQSNKK